VGEREFPEQGFALRGDFDQDFPVVERVSVAAHHAERGQAVDELDHGVVLELELPGEGADRRQVVGGQPLDRQQQLVLLRLEAGVACRLLAERQKAADQMAEKRQILIIWFAQPRNTRGHVSGELYRSTI